MGHAMQCIPPSRRKAKTLHPVLPDALPGNIALYVLQGGLCKEARGLLGVHGRGGPLPGVTSQPDARAIPHDQQVVHKIALHPGEFWRQLDSKIHEVEEGVAGNDAVCWTLS